MKKLLLRGVPTQYRAYIWQKMIHFYVADVKEAAGEGYFEDLLRHQNIMKDDKVRMSTFNVIQDWRVL